jgi:hypothetical protein
MDEAFAAELEAIPWLAAVGQPVGAELPWPFTQVASWAEALACYDDDWDRTKQAAFNRLTSFLSVHHPDAYTFGWGPTIRAVKAQITTPLAERVWRPYGERHGLPATFPDLIASDVQLAAMEHAYRRLAGRPEFLLPLLRVYRAGHFPCGWYGGEWPEGFLAVF